MTNKWIRRIIAVASFAVVAATIRASEPSKGMEVVMLCMAAMWWSLAEVAEFVGEGYAVLYMRALKRLEGDPKASSIAKDIHGKDN